MKARFLVLATMLGSTAVAEDVFVHQGPMSDDYCDVQQSIDLIMDGNEGDHLFWETYRHTSQSALYVAVKGSRIDIFPNKATLSCIDDAMWRRLSEVIPNDGEEAITFLGKCTVSVPSKPHTFHIAFTPRYGDVTSEGSRMHKKVMKIFKEGSFIDKSHSFPNYHINNYRAIYTSCMRITAR